MFSSFNLKTIAPGAVLCGLALGSVALFPEGERKSPPEAEPPEFVHPIQPAHASGSFGEYRKYGRYHHGLDYKTFTRVGLPVRMPREGVVARFQSSDHGYGNALWVNSGDARFTFGHLQDFSGDQPGLEYFRDALHLLLPRDAFLFDIPPYFRFRQGEILARSGESGSGAPHLHFEVLRAGVYYDPLRLPGLGIEDRTAPKLLNVYLETGPTLLKFPVIEVEARPAGAGEPIEPGAVREQFKLTRPASGQIQIPARASVRFLVGAYDTMAATNRNGVGSFALRAGERTLYKKSLATIDGTDLGGAAGVYHAARTVIGSEYVYILYSGGAGTVDRSHADATGQVRVTIEVSDSRGNRSLLKIPLRFQGDEIPAEYRASGGAGDAARGAFRGVAGGSSVTQTNGEAKLVLNFTDRSLFGGGLVRTAALAENEVPREVLSSQDEAGKLKSEPMEDFYLRVGPAFIVETQDLFYRDGAQGSAIMPDSGQGRAALYYYNDTVKRWLLLARPYDTRGGKSYYSFAFRGEGAIAQLVDRSAPRVDRQLLWDHPPSTDEKNNIIREYTIIDRGSGVDLKRIEVLYDGRAYPHDWIEDRSTIRVVIPGGLVPRRGALVSVRVADHGDNFSAWYFDCVDPLSTERR